MDYPCQFLVTAVPLAVYAFCLFIIQQHKKDELPSKPQHTETIETPHDKPNPDTILACEFEYARVTASETVEDRARAINFYLAIFGVSVTGALAAQQGGLVLPRYTGTVLLFTLSSLGWVYFLILIQLRKAWFDSAQTMNRIKDFYEAKDREFYEVQTAQGPVEAFRWRTYTLPARDRRYTVFHYSSFLIALLNSLAYAGAVAFFFWENDRRSTAWELWLPGLLLAAVLLWLQMFFWQRMLEIREESQPGKEGNEEPSAE